MITKNKKTNILLHIPHSSLKVPSFARRKFLLSGKELENEIKYGADIYTDELFADKRCYSLVAKHSRLFCDMERFRDDKLEPMSEKGRGVVYEKTFNDKNLLKPLLSYKKKVLKFYYDTYHNKLNKLTEKIIKKYGSCLILDCHSFSESFFDDGDFSFPDICIGVNDFFCNDKIKELIINHFKSLGYSVAINFPYKQSMVPNAYLKKLDSPLVSIMIEVNKKLYLNEKDFKKEENFLKLTQQIKSLINKISKYLIEN